MKYSEDFIKAYHEFKELVDFAKSGILPDMDNLIWYMLMGVPHVPADEDTSEEAAIIAIDQRVAILKAVFVEVNKNQPDDFLNQGMNRYDQAGEKAKDLLKEMDSPPDVAQA